MSGFGTKAKSDLRHRLLSLALIALLIQSTLPYLLTNCPMYGAATHVSASAGHPVMSADCPMLMAHQAKIPSGPTDKHPATDRSALTCPLCAVMSPLHAFVVAGLIALPPPARPVASSFTVSFSQLESLPVTPAFSARAPPRYG